MRRLILLSAVLLLVAACAAEEPGATTGTAAVTTTSTTTTTSTVPPTTDAPVTTSMPVAGGVGLVIAAVDFEGGVIVIRNDGSDDYDTAGHFVCNRPLYVALPAELLGPGESVTVGVSELGVTQEDGEVGVYSSRSFGSAEAILSYVQWGSDSHGRTSVAVEAGIWPAGGVVETGGGSLELTGDPTSPSGWSSR